MPVDRRIAFKFLGHPPSPASLEMLVSGEGRRSFGRFAGDSIPMDYRSYIAYGHTILTCGVKVPTRFRIDTRSPTLLAGQGTWHIDGVWYHPFEPEALSVLGVSAEQSRPFSWTSNIPIETVEEPPYREGQVLHARNPPGPYRPIAPIDPSWRRQRFNWTTRRFEFDAPRPDLEIERGEVFEWSTRAWSVRTAQSGDLVLTSRRVFFQTRSDKSSVKEKPFEVGLREAVDVGCVRIEHLPSGALGKLALRLLLVADREEIFEVDDVVQAIEQFSEGITPIGG